MNQQHETLGPCRPCRDLRPMAVQNLLRKGVQRLFSSSQTWQAHVMDSTVCVTLLPVGLPTRAICWGCVFLRKGARCCCLKKKRAVIFRGPLVDGSFGTEGSTTATWSAGLHNSGRSWGPGRSPLTRTRVLTLLGRMASRAKGNDERMHSFQ